MNRRTFLKTIPVICSFPQFCKALDETRSESGTTTYDPQFFRQIPYKSHQQQLAYEDLWNPAFQNHCRQVMKDYRQRTGVHGIRCLQDLGPIPSWNITQSRLEREMDWVSFIRQLPTKAPGKKRYVQFLQKRYGNHLREINHRYGSCASHPEDLLAHPFAKVDLQNRSIFEDDQAFVRILQQQWRRIATSLLDSHSSRLQLVNGPFPHPCNRETAKQAWQSRFAIL